MPTQSSFCRRNWDDPWSTHASTIPIRSNERGQVCGKDLEAWPNAGSTLGLSQALDGDGCRPAQCPHYAQHSAYFTRGTGHDDYAHYSEDRQDWENNLLRLKRKVAGAKDMVPAPIIEKEYNSPIGFISFGSSNMAALEAVDCLAAAGMPVDYLRIKAIPFTQAAEDFLKAHQEVYVIEANRDGQMKDILTINFPQYAARMHSLAKCDGLSLSAEWICAQYRAAAGKEV